MNLNYVLCPTAGLAVLIENLPVPEGFSWPTYHTPVAIIGPLVMTLIFFVYLAVAKVLCALLGFRREETAKTKKSS